jgi:hypothetical protein
MILLYRRTIASDRVAVRYMPHPQQTHPFYSPIAPSIVPGGKFNAPRQKQAAGVLHLLLPGDKL